MPRRILLVLTALALLATGSARVDALLPEESPVPAPTTPPATTRLPCDPLDGASCLLPFPNDRFTTVDPAMPTGRRVNFLAAEMPRSAAGKPIDPAEWNRNDGFSPGSMVLTFVPGLDLHATWGTQTVSTGGLNDPADHLADIARYEAADAPILIVDATTGERWPFWSELDDNAGTGDHERLLILRPAVNFREGHTYYVALRNLRDASGALIPAGLQFAAYRDGAAGPADPTFEETRRPEIDAVIDGVEAAEVARGNPFDRGDLFLAWKFSVASGENLAGRALHIRDDAFAKLGDTNLADGVVEGSPPAFTVTRVVDRPGDTRRLREVHGTVTVPNYLDRYPLPLHDSIDNGVQEIPAQAVPAARFLYGPDGRPMQNPAVPTVDVPFVCTVPRAASAQDPARPLLYGHGLLGDRGESVGGSTDRARERNFMPCAVNWMGFAEYDLANAFVTLADPSNMPSMADRAQQGFLNFLYLGRALAHPSGFATHTAFRDGAGLPLMRSEGLAYDGNSQGGIMGGALTALAVDHTRASLGVPGMNYSTLLNRSVDWEGPLVDPDDPVPAYSSVLYTMFPDKQEQQVVMALLQMLWDRAEGNGYAQHMTSDPFPNTPAHQVLLHVAYGDFQVANVSAEVEARTIGARVMGTALLPGRHWAAGPQTYFGLAPIPTDAEGKPLPWNGSALVYWDSGNYAPPNANIPPRLDGGDPHEDPRRDPRSGDQRATFWRTGTVVDPFAGGPYLVCFPGRESTIPRVPSEFTIPDWC